MKFSYGTIVGLGSDIKRVEKRLDGGWFFKSYTIDEIFDHVQICIGVFPKEKFTFKVMPTKKNVQAIYKARYKKTLYTSAFMSKSLMTIWISAQDVTPRILAYEFAHLYLKQTSIVQHLKRVMRLWRSGLRGAFKI